jgi:hypothetical protein
MRHFGVLSISCTWLLSDTGSEMAAVAEKITIRHNAFHFSSSQWVFVDVQYQEHK